MLFKLKSGLFARIDTKEMTSERTKKPTDARVSWCAWVLDRSNGIDEKGDKHRPSSKDVPGATEIISAVKRFQQKRPKRSRSIGSDEMQRGVKLPTMKAKAGRTQSGKHIGFMCTSGVILEHPTAEILLSYSEEGCKVNCSPDWMAFKMQQAIEKGPCMRPSQKEENHMHGRKQGEMNSKATALCLSGQAWRIRTYYI